MSKEKERRIITKLCQQQLPFFFILLSLRVYKYRPILLLLLIHSRKIISRWKSRKTLKGVLSGVLFFLLFRGDSRTLKLSGRYFFYYFFQAAVTFNSSGLYREKREREGGRGLFFCMYIHNWTHSGKNTSEQNRENHLNKH